MEDKRRLVKGCRCGRRPSVGPGRFGAKSLLSAGLGVSILTGLFLQTGCDGSAWNNPYPREHTGQSILYSSFSERPKHLDPVRSYSSNEYAFIAQIYEPPVQYHFLKRPYEIVPLTAMEVPVPRYLDAGRKPLPDDVRASRIVFSEYEIKLQPGINFQPHPAFAKNENGDYLYHDLSEEDLASINVLQDFPATGSRELTAHDYVYQIKRLAFPRLHAPIAGVMQDYILGFKAFGEKLEQEYARRRPQTGLDRPFLDLREHTLEGVEVVDRYTYRILLKGKYPQFVFWLAMPFFAPMPWEADRFYSQPGFKKRNITLDWYPVGTGPFMLLENNPNLRMVLERNPNFHQEFYPAEGMPEDGGSGLLDDAGKPLPFIDRAIYSLEKENIPYWNKFLQGYYDNSGVASDSFDQAVQFTAQGEIQLTDEMAEKGIRLNTAVTTSIFYMGFNMLDPVIGGESKRARLLRRAVSIAVDFEEFISIFTNGRGIAAQGPIPPGIFGYTEGKAGINGHVYRVEGGQHKRREIQEAKKLLVQAGYADGRDGVTGEPLILYFDAVASGPDDKARLNWLRKQFAKIGIQLVLRTTDYNRFQEKMRKGTAQIFMWGWNADYPDPENFLFLLYGPNSKVQHGGENASNYDNRRYNQLFDRMKNIENGPERQKIIQEMIEILRRDAPWVWGYHPKAFSLHHSWYKNAKPNLMANNTLKYKRVDAIERDMKRKRWNSPVVWPIIVVVTILVVTAIPAVLTFRKRERSAAL